eukprot:TRINITY_DN6394_c0_g1_i1.p1 TRINITY_DN6394_c0_g1~~TRINITY_DN6394_c0_g1_i1.p1  ORF type:complete len:236 (+),score=46.58 TRINITY_DN6394_c0_g1_i1:506-1213(+)
MIQCIGCEDWFHDFCITENGKHPMPHEDDFADFICEGCMHKLPFLYHYSHLQCPLPHPEAAAATVTATAQAEATTAGAADDAPPTFAPPPVCPLGTSQKPAQEGHGFFLDGWQNCLCKCALCSDTYKASHCPWIFEPPKEEAAPPKEDDKTAASGGCTQLQTANAATSTSIMAAGVAELSKIPRIQQVEVAQQLNEYSRELNYFLKELKQSGKEVVTKEDIEEFTRRIVKKRKLT